MESDFRSDPEADPRIRIHIKMNRIRNTGYKNEARGSIYWENPKVYYIMSSRPPPFASMVNVSGGVFFSMPHFFVIGACSVRSVARY